MQITLLFVILFTYTHCNGSVNPSNYIWLNYNTKIAVKSKTLDHLTVTLPCEARIGKCSCLFTSLPSNWQSAKDCSIVFPKQDSKKYGGFALKATMTEATGQRLNADLVINFNNGYLKLTDRPTFMNKNKYDDTIPNNVMNNGYGESIAMATLPLDFPTLLQIDLLISSGNIFSISTSLNNILQQYAPCSTKIPYLTAIKKSLDQQINQNNLRMSKNNNDFQSLQQTLINLEIRRKQELAKSGIQTKIAQAKQKLNAASKDLVGLMADQIKYKNLASSCLKSMINASTVDKNAIIHNAQTEIKNLTTSLDKINKWLQSAFTNRKILRKAQLDTIIQIALDISSLTTKRQDVKQIVNSYNSNTIQLINNQIEQFQTMIKINDFKQITSIPQKNNTTYLNSANKLDDKRIADLNEQNNSLNKNIDILQQVVQKLENMCQKS